MVYIVILRSRIAEVSGFTSIYAKHHFSTFKVLSLCHSDTTSNHSASHELTLAIL